MERRGVAGRVKVKREGGRRQDSARPRGVRDGIVRGWASSLKKAALLVLDGGDLNRFKVSMKSRGCYERRTTTRMMAAGRPHTSLAHTPAPLTTSLRLSNLKYLPKDTRQAGRRLKHYTRRKKRGQSTSKKGLPVIPSSVGVLKFGSFSAPYLCTGGCSHTSGKACRG